MSRAYPFSQSLSRAVRNYYCYCRRLLSCYPVERTHGAQKISFFLAATTISFGFRFAEEANAFLSYKFVTLLIQRQRVISVWFKTSHKSTHSYLGREHRIRRDRRSEDLVNLTEENRHESVERARCSFVTDSHFFIYRLRNMLDNREGRMRKKRTKTTTNLRLLSNY